MNNIKDVYRFALEVHGDQKYGDGNEPYICHLSRVAMGFLDYTRQAIALLHDVIEDTDVTMTEIDDKFGHLIASQVYILSRTGNEDYLNDYIPYVGKSLLARQIKIADLEDNIYHCEYIYPSFNRLLPRYHKAIEYLKNIENGKVND